MRSSLQRPNRPAGSGIDSARFPTAGSPTRRLLGLALGLLLLWAPLPFASVTAPAAAFLRIMSLLLLAIGGFAVLDRNTWRVARLPALLLVAVGVLGVLQLVSVPEPLAAMLFPSRAEFRAAADSILGPLDLAATGGLSMAPTATHRAALSWLALAATFLVGAMAGAGRRHRRWIAGCFLAAALFQVLYGARRWMTGALTIWGVAVPGDPSRLRGTYVNSNHLAVYLEMGLAVAFAWSWWALRRARRESAADRRLALVAPPMIVWLVLFLGLAFTGSRGGLVAAGVGTAVQGIVVAAERRRWQLAPLGLVVSAVALGVVAVVGLEEGLGRLLATSQHEVAWSSRRAVAFLSLELWRASPVVGTGLGSFVEVFPLAQTASLSGVTWHHAHNDYLEMLVTAGLVGLGLVLLAAWTTVTRLRRLLGEGERSEDFAAALAAFGMVAAVAVHEAFDFGLTMPANGFTLTALLGAAVGALAPTLRRQAAAEQ